MKGIVNGELIELKTYGEYYEGFTLPFFRKYGFIFKYDYYGCDCSIEHENIKYRIIYKAGAVTYYYYKYNLAGEKIYETNTCNVHEITSMVYNDLKKYRRKSIIDDLL